LRGGAEGRHSDSRMLFSFALSFLQRSCRSIKKSKTACLEGLLIWSSLFFFFFFAYPPLCCFVNHCLRFAILALLTCRVYLINTGRQFNASNMATATAPHLSNPFFSSDSPSLLHPPPHLFYAVTRFLYVGIPFASPFLLFPCFCVYGRCARNLSEELC
jgi:hypothetical protein